MKPEIEASEIRRVFGAGSVLDAGDWVAESLVHNPQNAVTRGVWRVSVGGHSAILKQLTFTKKSASAAWSASDDPRHWNFWRREALFYQSTLRSRLADWGIGSPEPIAVVERSDTEIAVWLEDVDGTGGDRFGTEDHREAARALGRTHGMAAAVGDVRDEPWLSRRFLRSYSHKPVDWELLEDDRVWEGHLVSECLGAEVRESGRLLVRERELLLRIMERLPRTLCHLDFWPMNLIRRASGEIVALDWAFVGDGAIGEDLGNHVPDSAFDLFVSPETLPTLDEATFDAFVEGLREAGWPGDPMLARLAVCASAVKYVWLLPLMLERAVSGNHASYGGGGLSEPSRQYRARGRVLNFLAGWVREARRLEAEVRL